MTSIWDIVAYPDSSDLIYVGGMSHYVDTEEEPTLGLLYRSRDGGKTWEELWTPDDIWIMCLAIDPISETIYAGTGGADASRIYRVYRSTDGGITWEETSGWQSPGNSIFEIAIDPSSPNRLYAGTGGALFKSTDYGANWTAQAGMPFPYTLLIDPDSPSTLYAGTMGGGIFKFTQETGVEAVDRGHTENAPFCVSNFPNPFNTTTQIAYRIPTTSHVALKIFDTSGRLISVLVDDQEQAGYHQITWNGTNRYGTEVGSGIYYIKMQAEKQIVTRKVMLIK